MIDLRLTPREITDAWTPEQRAANLAEIVANGRAGQAENERRGIARADTPARRVVDELYAERRRANLLACDLEIAEATIKTLGIRVVGLIEENRRMRAVVAEHARRIELGMKHGEPGLARRGMVPTQDGPADSGSPITEIPQ